VAQVEVELADLRGWARQVGRASSDMGSAHSYATSNIADAEFGKILELISGPYAGMIPKLHQILQEDSTRLGKTGNGLNSAARAYKEADDRATGRLAKLPGGQTAAISDDGVANGFDDRVSATAALAAPGSAGAQLPDPPEVSLGLVFNTICDLIASITGFDIREKITRWVAGDVDKAARHVAAWKALAACCDDVSENLGYGRKQITSTWTGAAADAAGAHMDKWTAALTEQAGAMRKMSEHLWDIVGQAVQMATVVCDIIKTVIDVVSAGLAAASIPLYGEWKLIKSVWDGVKMAWSAWKCVQVFLDALKLVIDTIKMCVNYFTAAKLPAAPAVGPA
jgi:uncharacterized protein YukE